MQSHVEGGGNKEEESISECEQWSVCVWEGRREREKGEMAACIRHNRVARYGKRSNGSFYNFCKKKTDNGLLMHFC